MSIFAELFIVMLIIEPKKYNLMTPTVAILNIPCLDPNPLEFVRLELEQVFNDHHRAEIVLDLERMDENVLASPLSKSALINEKIILDIQEGEDMVGSYTFSGLITDVQIELDRGNHGLMYIYAASPTIELERGRMLQTFSDTDLSGIVGDVTKGLIRLRIYKKPRYTSPVKFSMQFRETDFQYLRRLA